MQGRLAAVKPVEVGDEALETAMQGIVQLVPVDFAVVIPFARLADFIAHEQQLLAGMGPHEGEIGAQIGELLPFVAPSARVE